MNNEASTLLIALVVGLPILALVLVAVRLIWRNLAPKWQYKIADYILIPIGTLLAILTVLSLPFLTSPEAALEEELTHVHGTVEDVYRESEYGRYGQSYFVVEIKGHRYRLEDSWASYASYSNFNPNRWRKEAVGQTVELAISQFVDPETRDCEGSVYGIRTADGTVLLDEKLSQEADHRGEKQAAVLLPCLGGAGVLMTAAGVRIRRRRKQAGS